MTENDKLTEEKIFESATEIFIEKGMDGARMKDIADHAGINKACLLYTSDAADDLHCVDLGGRRIIKKKNNHSLHTVQHVPRRRPQVMTSCCPGRYNQYPTPVACH